MKNTLFLFILFVLFGCSESTKTSAQIEDIEVTPVEKDTGEENLTSETHSTDSEYFYRIEDSVILAKIMSLDSTYSKTPFYFKNESDTFYYVVKGRWNQNTTSNEFIKGDFKMGIVNGQKTEVLPVEYDKIYSPNTLSKDIIEIEKLGEFGLFNFKTLQVTDIKYDFFFPSFDENIIAYGQKGAQLFSIDKNMNETLTQKKISYREYVKKWNYEITSVKNVVLIDSYTPHYLNDANEGAGVSFTPSFIDRLKVIPSAHYNMVTRESNFGTVEANVSFLDSRENKDGLLSFISKFYEMGIDARDFQLTKYSLHTTDKSNVSINNTELISFGDEHTNYCHQGDVNIEFVDSIIIRVPTVIKAPDGYKKTDALTMQKLYRINDEGLIEELISKRFFAFTKYIKIDETYFQGCFCKEYNESDNMLNQFNGEGSLILWNHLDEEQLDLMRNEIFAEYGYKFKTKKWQDYFSNQYWYKATHDNVDEFLTEIDKHNIDVILKAKEKILKNPKIVNKRKEQQWAAG